MTAHRNEIELDQAILTDKSYEIARLWVTSGGGSTVWIASNVMQDPRAFGRLMADAMRYGAAAYAGPDRSEADAMAAIEDGFLAAMDAARGQGPAGKDEK